MTVFLIVAIICYSWCISWFFVTIIMMILCLKYRIGFKGAPLWTLMRPLIIGSACISFYIYNLINKL